MGYKKRKMRQNSKKKNEDKHFCPTFNNVEFMPSLPPPHF